MKKIIENLAVTMVLLLFIVVIALVIKYNMINDSTDDTFVVPETVVKKETKQEQTKAYLNTLESYGDDVDVKVDPTKEETKNVVKVTSELAEDELDDALKTDEKKEYVKKLENYSDEKKSADTSEALEDVAPEKAENGDNIGSELDAILGN